MENTIPEGGTEIQQKVDKIPHIMNETSLVSSAGVKREILKEQFRAIREEAKAVKSVNGVKPDIDGDVILSVVPGIRGVRYDFDPEVDTVESLMEEFNKLTLRLKYQIKNVKDDFDPEIDTVETLMVNFNKLVKQLTEANN